MIRVHTSWRPAVLTLALLSAGCDISVGEHGFSMDVASGKAQDESTRTYTIAPGGTLEIANVNGTIHASNGTGPVEVRIERVAKSSTDEAAQELLKEIEIAETASADRVRLETKVAKRSWGRSSHEVRYWVKVPKGLRVDLVTVNGGVRLENLDNTIVAGSTNGGVRGVSLRGAVKASTTNGGVQIDMSAVTGEIELETTNGGIRLQLPPDVKADLDARCTNGGISVGDFDLQGERSRRRAVGSINGGGMKISVETTNGGIRISSRGADADTP